MSKPKIASLAFSLIGAFSIGLLLFGVGAARAVPAEITQGYGGSSMLQPGMIVALDSKNSNDVTALNEQNVSQMLGVVVSPTAASLTLGKVNQQEVYVTNFGQHDVLVSNQNGAIAPGDYISISSLSGIGMKAQASEPVVLGQATASFNGSGDITSALLKEPNGSEQTVDIGMISVNLSISNNPAAQSPQGVPVFLGKITKFATNKSVSAARIYLSLIIVLVGVIVAITVIYSGVKSGIISLGRNPLAKKTISGGMLKVIGVGVIIFAASLGAAYAILL